MKQLYFTSCKAGDGLQGRAGLQVRAVTEGVGPNTLAALQRYCYYFLPFGDEYLPNTVDPETAPIRLAFLKTHDVGTIALQAIYFGIDPASGRPGNPFVHVLFGFEEIPVGPLEVLSRWQSPFWRRDAEGMGKELPEVVDLGEPSLDEDILTQCADDSSWREALQFLLNAFLQGDPTLQIFIVADPPDIVGLLMGVARLIPSCVRDGLTFTTYEKEIEGHTARFVGTTWGSGFEDQDIPEAYYQGRGFVANLKTNRFSANVQSLSYVEHVLGAMTRDDSWPEAIEPLLSFMDTCSLSSTNAIEPLFNVLGRLDTADPLTAEDLELVLRYAQLRQKAFKSEVFIGKLLDVVIGAEEWLAEFMAELQAEFDQRQDIAQRIWECLWTKLLESAEAGRIEEVDAYFQRALPLVQSCGDLGKRLFTAHADTARIPVPLRAHLLPNWYAAKYAVSDPDQFDRWITAESSHEVGVLLGGLSNADQRAHALMVNFLGDAVPDAALMKSLKAEHRMLAKFLGQVAKVSLDNAPKAAELVLANTNSDLLLDLLAADIKIDPCYTAPMLNAMGREALDNLIQEQGSQLLELAAAGGDIGPALVAFESQDIKHVAETEAVLDFYAKCVERKFIVDAAVVDRIDRWVFIGRILREGFADIPVDAVRGRIGKVLEDIKKQRGMQTLIDLHVALLPMLLSKPHDSVFEYAPAIISADAQPKKGAVRRGWLNLAGVACEHAKSRDRKGIALGLMLVAAGRTDLDNPKSQVFWRDEMESRGSELFKFLGRSAQLEFAGGQESWSEPFAKVWNRWVDLHSKPSLMERFNKTISGFLGGGPKDKY